MKSSLLLPPRCREHRNHLAGCPTCKEYARVRIARRARLRAYGRWTTGGQAELEPAAQHLDHLHGVGMTYLEISKASGVSVWSIQRIINRRTKWIWASTARQILAVEPLPAMVSGVGAARRLQALSRAGYTIPDLKAHYKGNGWIRRLFWYRQGVETLPRSSHLAIARIYAELWGTDGPHPRQTVWATNRGWFPFEAWTDATIDDPNAQPYSDPEAQAYVDDVKVAKAKLPAGHPDRVLFTDLSYAEQCHLFREHLATSASWRVFAARYRAARTSPKDVSARWRAAMRRLRVDHQGWLIDE